MQEASLWRIQSPGSTLTGHPKPATTVVYDFIGTLISDLAACGLNYTVVGTVNGLDGQLPDAAGDDIRLTDRVALLARADLPPGQLRWSNVQAADFQTSLTVHFGGGAAVTVRNGWVSADVTKRGATFRVVTTHLDANVPAINVAQAQELLAAPGNTSLPLIVLGDLNSPADGSGSATYSDLIAAGFQDTWAETNMGEPGFTCCQREDLRNPVSQLSERIDYVLFRGGFNGDAMSILGAGPADRTPSGLWPSDHASLVASLDLPRVEDTDGALRDLTRLTGPVWTDATADLSSDQNSARSVAWNQLFAEPVLPMQSGESRSAGQALEGSSLWNHPSAISISAVNNLLALSDDYLTAI